MAIQERYSKKIDHIYAPTPNFPEEELVGREEYKLITSVSPDVLKFLSEVRKAKPYLNRYHDYISSKLRTNSTVAYSKELGYDRPASAYFTILQKDLTPILIVEWGKVDLSSGVAALHDFLYKTEGYKNNMREGGIVRSGHIGNIKILGTNFSFKVALLDSVASMQSVKQDSPEHAMSMTMLAQGILPVTSDGYILKPASPMVNKVLSTV